MLKILEKIEDEQPFYLYRDRYRLENIQECLDVVKKGPEYLRIKALGQIEQTLLRIHNTYGIAWDFGGVLMDGHNKFFIELYAQSHGVDLSKERLINLWEIIFKSDPIPGVNYDALKIGQATPEQFAAHAIEHFNLAFAEIGKESLEISDREIQNFLTLYYSHYDPKHENREVLQRLDRLGIRQYGLTNNFMAKIEYFLERHEFDYLKSLIMLVSEKFGASKPDAKIYLSFKQHVWIDRFVKEKLQVALPNRAIDSLWQATFGRETSDNGQLSREAIAQFNAILQQFGFPSVDTTVFAQQWLDFWAESYDRIAEQTIFIDDKIKNLDRAFACEGILGVHYDANQGQKLVERPVIQELLEQEHLKQTVRTLREFMGRDSLFGQRVRQAIDRLMPFRIRHEKLRWQEHANKHQPIINTLSDERIYTLLQRHYKQLYTTHFQLGQLVERQYALVRRLASLPEYNYDEARQIVLELFETSDLFLDQNRDLYPWQETEIPKSVATDLGDIQESESLLKKRLLAEIKRKIIEYIDVLDVAHQLSVRDRLQQLQTEANDLETIGQLTGRLLQNLSTLNSIRVLPWQQIERLFANLQGMLAPIDQQLVDPQELRSFLTHQIDEWYRQFDEEAKRISLDLMPLRRIIGEWERDLHELESTYFQQYYRWKTHKDREIAALYQDPVIDGMRDRFSAEELYQFIRGLMLKLYDLPRWKDITKPTVILISGTSGSGKSTLSTNLARGFGIQKVFSTDETGRANTKAILDFLFGAEEASQSFPALYQSSFAGTIESYYYQAIATAIGVEGLAKRLQEQNTSAAIEGVGLMPGLLSEEMFELLNIDWFVVEVDRQHHCQHFEKRSRSASQRNAKRYQDRFEMIRQIQEQIVRMGLKHELTIVENNGSIQQAVNIAAERVKSPLTSQFIDVRDPIRDEMKELLAIQRQHLPLKVCFDVKRAAINLGIAETNAIELLHRFGFEPVPNRRHQWIRRAMP